MSQNVVTYVVEVVADNSDGRLLPYLTANLYFEVKRADDTLYLPNAALRWRPENADQVASGVDIDSLKPGARVWVEAGKGKVRPVAVEIVLRTDTAVAIKSDELKEGQKVVVGAMSSSEIARAQASPFMPAMRSRPKSTNSAKAAQR